MATKSRIKVPVETVQVVNLRGLSRGTGFSYYKLFGLADRGLLPKPTHVLNGSRPLWELDRLPEIAKKLSTIL